MEEGDEFYQNGESFTVPRRVFQVQFKANTDKYQFRDFTKI